MAPSKGAIAIYVYSRGEDRIILPVFVDDMTFASKSLTPIDQIISQLSQHFKLRNLGPTTQLLGIKIDRDRPSRTISLSQRQYSLDILEHFGMADCKPVTTPMEPNLRLSRSQSPQTAEEISFMHGVYSMAPSLKSTGLITASSYADFSTCASIKSLRKISQMPTNFYVLGSLSLSYCTTSSKKIVSR
jgi:Reverse transcriptase (RNA-dependent DNA polymerase)